MHYLLLSKYREIAALCDEFGVERLEVFGSAARDDFVEGKSDFDFIVVFKKSDDLPALAQYFDFKDAMAHLLRHDVDLHEGTTIRNPYLKAHIDKDRKLVFSAS